MSVSTEATAPATAAAPARRRPTTLNRALANRQCMLGAVLLALLVAVALLAPVIAPSSPTQQSLEARLQPPGYTDPDGTRYLLGTDQFGRDILSRLIYGARIPLIVGFSSAVLGLVIGTIVGVAAGYFRGRVDTICSALIDIQLSLPFILVALAVVAVFGGSALNIILVFALTSWGKNARVARAATLSVRESQFIRAAAAVGGGTFWIIRRHVIPNAMAPMLVITSVQIAQFIIFESAFGFFGIGVPPPEPTWGNMLADARTYLDRAWWLGTFPGVAIALAALAANLLGDGLRDALDPREARNTRGF